MCDFTKHRPTSALHYFMCIFKVKVKKNCFDYEQSIIELLTRETDHIIRVIIPNSGVNFT